MKFNKILAGTFAAAAVLAAFPMTASVITAETIDTIGMVGTSAPAMETFETGSDTWKEDTSENVNGNAFLLERLDSPKIVFASAPLEQETTFSYADVMDYTEETETTTEASTEPTTAQEETKSDVSDTAEQTVPDEPEVQQPAEAEQTQDEPEQEITIQPAEETPVVQVPAEPVVEPPVSSSGYLTSSAGVFYGPSGKETYYNLDMSGVVSMMRNRGFSEEEYPYWVRDDGVKMFGSYVMVAACLDIRPRGSLIETSLGMAIVCDTGGFAASNQTQIDIAVTW